MKMGAKITFVPAVVVGEQDVITPDGKRVRRTVTGRIVYINRPHLWFTVEYPAGRGVLRESMKFIPREG